MSRFERRSFADQLSIETPEQVTLEYPLAGLGSRFVALLVDHLIQGGALLLLGLLVIFMNLLTGSRMADRLAGKWFIASLILVAFLLLWGYFTLFEALWHGQTPGKRLLKLRVIKDSGRQVTLFESLTRNLLRFVDFLPSLYLVGTLSMLANKQNQRLGDLAAGTLVVHERTDEQPLLWTGVPAAANTTAFSSPAVPDTLFPAEAAHRLGSSDLELIEAFFARALDLPLPVRASMAERILAELARKAGSEIPEGHPERILEGIAGSLRSRSRRL